MRYKIEYGKAKTDKWGHLMHSEFSTEFADNLIEAREKAIMITCKHRKHDVVLLDLEGPELYGATTWVIYGFKGGKKIYVNKEYFEALKKLQEEPESWEDVGLF